MSAWRTANAVLRVAQLDADSEPAEFPSYEDFDDALVALDQLKDALAAFYDWFYRGDGSSRRVLPVALGEQVRAALGDGP